MKTIYSFKTSALTSRILTTSQIIVIIFLFFFSSVSAQSPDTLKLKFFIEGYYQGGGYMTTVLYNQGVDANPYSTNVDTVVVQLRSPANVATLVQSYKGLLQIDGTINCTFPSSLTNHDYYIVISYKNAMETWSDAPVTMSSTVSYDFTTAASQAYGSNMVDVYTEGIWSFYSGDVSDSTEVLGRKDGVIDLYDFYAIYPDIEIGNGGYLISDINGDGGVDASDFFAMLPNIENGVAEIKPGNASCSMTVSAATDSDIACHGGTTSVTVTESSGTGSIFGTTHYTGVAAGTYTYTLTDAYGCTASATPTVSQPTAVSATISTPSNVSCYGGSNGSDTVHASGIPPGAYVTFPYSYLWAPSGGTDSIATGLSAGTYSVTVTGAGCTATVTTTITQPSSALTASITSTTEITDSAGNNGTATVSVSGGTPSYTYSWSPSGGTNATITTLTVSTFTVTATDSRGCTVTASVEGEPGIACIEDVNGSSLCGSTFASCNSTIYVNSSFQAVAGGDVYLWTLTGSNGDNFTFTSSSDAFPDVSFTIPAVASANYPETFCLSICVSHDGTTCGAAGSPYCVLPTAGNPAGVECCVTVYEAMPPTAPTITTTPCYTSPPTSPQSASVPNTAGYSWVWSIMPPTLCPAGDYNLSSTTTYMTSWYMSPVCNGELQLCVTMTDNTTGCPVATCKTIDAGIGCRLAEPDALNATGVSQPAAYSKLYPNPSDGMITLEYQLSNNTGLIEVFNVIGEMVYSGQLDGDKNKFEFDIGDLCCGMFEYRVIDGTNVIAQGRLVLIK